MLSKDYLAQLAYSFQQFGWVPISLKNKTPIGKNWQNLRNDAIKDEIDISQGRYPTRVRQIEHLYDAGLANNVGILTGAPSGIVVFDIEKTGIDKWNQLVNLNHNDLPKTFTVHSGEGGYHLYFKYHPYMDKIPNRNRILDYPIDFRTNGGVIVSPGSYSYSADKYYEVVDDQPIADLPPWLIGLLITDILYREGIKNPTIEQFNSKKLELGL